MSTQQTEADRFNAYLITKDRDEFAWLYKCFNRRMVSAANKLLNGDPVAEDVTQESWIVVTELPPPKTPILSAGAFLTNLVRRQAIGYMRSQHHENNMLSLDMLRSAMTREDEIEAFDIVDEVAGEVRWLEEHWDLIAPALEKISPAKREALEHIFIDGQTAAETSNQLNVPLGTVNSRAWRGMKELNLALGA